MPDNYVCGKCGKVAKTKQALERHAAYHEEDRPYSCEVCLQKFKNSDDRGKHYRRLKRDGKFAIACQVCHKHFKTAELLSKHVEMLGCQVSADVISVPAEAELGIDVSDVTNSKSDLSVTVKEESLPGDGVSCTCKICEAEFTGISFLKLHYKDVHNDTKKQVCIQCGQTLSSKDSLARHFSIFHQTSFPYSCEICNQKFKIKESLCRHVKFVHQDGGYPCPECQRVFTQPVNLKKHMAVHSAQKEYVCGICHREFRWKQALQKHEALHNERNAEKRSTNGTNLTCELKSDGYEVFDDIEDDVHHIETDTKLEDESQFEADEGTAEIDSVDKSLDVSSDNVFSDEARCNLDLKNSISSTNKTITERSNICKIDEKDKKLEESVTVKHMADTYDFPSDDDPGLDELSDNKNSVESLASLNRKRISSESVECMAANKKSKLSDTEIDLPVDEDEIEPHTDAIDSDVDTEVNLTGSPNVATDKDIVEISDMSVKAKTHVNTEDENSENDHSAIDAEDELLPLGYSNFTSFPTSKTQNAPRLVFKPSSIQNIMSKSNEAQEPRKLSDIQTDNSETYPIVQKPTKTKMKFPNKLGTLSQNLHNPFLIQDTRRSPVQLPISPVSASARNSDSKSPVSHIPRGKFSMVKHMLSLKNEDNFDKAVFENPLYNSLPEVKDLKSLVERHKITQKSDNCVVEKYDLSAKQNIPFHWLGMSVAMRRVEPSDIGKRRTDDLDMNAVDMDNVKCDVNGENGIYKEAEEKINDSRDEFRGSTDVKDSSEHFSMFKNGTTAESTGIDKVKDEDKRGFQAIKSLVALKKHIERHPNLIQNSVLSNPFVKQTVDNQDDSGVGILAQNDTLTVAECLNMLKRSSSVFDAMTCVQDSSHAKLRSKPVLSVNQTSQRNQDANFVCNSRLNATSFNSGEHSSNVSYSDSSLVSPSSPRGSSNSPPSLNSAIFPTHGSSVTTKPYCVTQFSHNISIPASNALSTMSSSSMPSSTTLQRQGSESFPCNTDKSLYLKRNQGYDLPNVSMRGPNCHSIEKRISLEYGLTNAASANISLHRMPLANTESNGLSTSWSTQPRLTSQNDSQRHHPAVSVHDLKDHQTFDQLQRIHRNTSNTPHITRCSEDDSFTNNVSFFSSRANSFQGVNEPTSDLFDVVDYSMPGKFDTHNSSLSMKTPSVAHTSPMWTKHNAEMSGCEKNTQRQDNFPSVLDFSFKYNTSVSNGDSLIENVKIKRPGLIEDQPSLARGRNDNVSIFDILKGPADKPRQLENVDYLLDAYV